MIEKSLKNKKEIDQNADLSLAFKQFSLESQRVELAYQSLENHFKSIHSSLQETQKKLYDKLAELDFTTSYLDAIISHISQGIIFIDLNGIITTYNGAAQEIFGIKANDLVLHSIWDYFPDTAFGFSLRDALQSKKAPKAMFITWKNQNTPLELEIEPTFVGLNTQICPSLTKNPPSIEIQGLLIIIRNLTEFRRLQTLANRSDRLKDLGEMAARMAHEIRNPLGGIKGFAALLEQDLFDRPELRSMAFQISEATNNLNRIVSNILSYTKPFQLQLSSIDLIPFLSDLLQVVQMDKSLSPGTECRFISKEKSLIISVDPQLLKSALLNLCINALQAMPNGGVLTLEVDKEESQIVIIVKDTGIGIPEENLDKIFSPFFTTKENGTGLGLSEVSKVVQAHGGTIEVDSKVSSGSRFILKIPLNSMS